MVRVQFIKEQEATNIPRLRRSITGISQGSRRKIGEGGGNESNQVQANDFHRRDAETRRDCEVGEDARERVVVSGTGGRSGSNLRGFANLRDKNGIFGGSRRESNQVQAIAFFFAGAGIRARTSTGTGGYARSAGFSPNRYMRGSRPEDVKNGVSHECPGFATHPCRHHLTDKALVLSLRL
jgi:hypothetical protein